MSLSIFLVLPRGIVLVVPVRGGSPKTGPVVVSILFEFFLTSASTAPAITWFIARPAPRARATAPSRPAPELAGGERREP
ncbi:hypothetical protein AB0O64_19130 [Streptomyces sp. NPDC088341]|uniref:hypothetical protein n=1 Tax=Streptomyces sp. NPDC088341 TaxID=3154870 RepID=UPI0034387D46